MNKNFPIQKVAEEFCNDLIESGDETIDFKPLGLFLSHDSVGRWIAIDNSTGRGWAVDFETEETAVHGLREKLKLVNGTALKKPKGKNTPMKFAIRHWKKW